MSNSPDINDSVLTFFNLHNEIRGPNGLNEQSRREFLSFRGDLDSLKSQIARIRYDQPMASLAYTQDDEEYRITITDNGKSKWELGVFQTFHTLHGKEPVGITVVEAWHLAEEPMGFIDPKRTTRAEVLQRVFQVFGLLSARFTAKDIKDGDLIPG